MVATLSFQFGLDHVVVPLSFLRSDQPCFIVIKSTTLNACKNPEILSIEIFFFAKVTGETSRFFEVVLKLFTL